MKRELERKARSTKRGKNWLIREALEQYLLGSSHDALRTEARRQSLLVGGRPTKDDLAWTEQAGEIDGWRA